MQPTLTHPTLILAAAGVLVAGGCVLGDGGQPRLTAQERAELQAYRGTAAADAAGSGEGVRAAGRGGGGAGRDLHRGATGRFRPSTPTAERRTDAMDPVRGSTGATSNRAAAMPPAAAARLHQEPAVPPSASHSVSDTASAASRPAGAASAARLSHRQLYGELPGPAAAARVSPLDDEGNLRRVTFTTEGADFDVDVDATGRWLVYASTRHRQTADLYLQRVDGTAVTQLTNDPARDEMPSLSPDGRRLAFASDRGGTFDIYLMDLQGGPAVKLTDDGAQNIHPSFSPDGRRLVYCSMGSKSGVWELVLLDVDRPGQRRIVGHGLFPVWSPRDNRIAYQRARERGSRWFSLWTLEVTDEGEVGRPVEVVASGNAAVITPEWSPDGRNLVFCTVLDPTADSPAGSRADIWICNVDGTGRTRLTHGRYGNLQPTWAADGSIYFVSNRGVEGIENVYALRPDWALRLANRTADTADEDQMQEATQAETSRERQPDSVEAQVPTPLID